MNASALAMLKAAAEKKKSNWKDPVVKQLKVTKEQYLQEKAEQEAKKNKKKAFLMGMSGDNEPVPTMGGGGPDPRVTELLGQVQRERSALQQEKQQWAQQMQEFKGQMQQLQSQMANGGATSSVAATEPTSSSPNPELRHDLDQALERIEALETENAKLRKQVQSVKSMAENADSVAKSAKEMAKKASSSSAASAISSNSNHSTGVSADELDDLVDRIETLEEKHSKLTLTVAHDSETLDDAKEDVAKLEKKLVTLEKAVATAAKQRDRSRDRSRARSTTRQAEPTTSTKTTTSAPVSSAPTPEPTRSTPDRSASSATTDSAADVLGPHSASDVAHAQASDAKLMAAIEGKSAGMYPKFSMSVKQVDGLKLVFFYKKLYVPEKLRTKTLKYYYDHHNNAADGGWTRVMAKHVIWPSLDTDVTNFKP